MITLKFIYQPLILSVAGEVPTVPNPSTLKMGDVGWKVTDLLIGQQAINVKDDIHFIRTEAGIEHSEDYFKDKIGGFASIDANGLIPLPDVDVTTITPPPTGTVYFGTTNGRLWKMLPDGSVTYMQKEITLNDYYTATATTGNLTLAYLVGAVGIQITKETQPLKPSEFTFDSATGLITFVVALQIYETIFITYQKNIDL